MTFDVCIVNSVTGSVEKRTHAFDKNQAEKIERGMNQNLDHAKFHTEIRKGLTKDAN